MADEEDGFKPTQDPDLLSVIGRGVVPPVLYDQSRRKEIGVPADDNEPGRYMVELNIKYRGGLRAAAGAFRELYDRVLTEHAATHPPIEISKSYFKCWMSAGQWRGLLAADEES